MKYTIISLIVVALLIVGGVYLFGEKKESAVLGTTNDGDNSLTGSPLSTDTNGQSNPDTDLKTQTKKEKNMITLETNYGKIVFETYNNDAPKTVNNFITLTEKGFYDNLTFHRVIKGFMIQGGDPNGNGTGGPGYKFEDELNPNTQSYKNGYKKGVVAMANSGPDTNGSQFFIMTEDYPLPNSYTIFGKVVEGQDVVDTIANVQTGANDKPISPVVMKKVTVE
ncbi:MAG: peptidylprolyl isomerase [Candidatus Paceibacterota bacterium]